jgi:hypothetical protein
MYIYLFIYWYERINIYIDAYAHEQLHYYDY